MEAGDSERIPHRLWFIGHTLSLCCLLALPLFTWLNRINERDRFEAPLLINCEWISLKAFTLSRRASRWVGSVFRAARA